MSKNILITCPTMNIHGGIRVLVEWSNHLSRRGHTVTFQIVQPVGYRWQSWIDFDPAVRVQVGQVISVDYDIVVASTPTLALMLDSTNAPCKKFYLLQMLENLFEPNNKQWVDMCIESYKVSFPIIGISKWVEEEVRKHRGDGKMYYVGNGVSDDFKPGQKDEGLTVLVEGWGGYPGNKNQAKDIELLACRVAEVLHNEYGAKIIAFSQFPLFDPNKPYGDLRHARQYEYILSEYHEAPSREELVRLYQRPTFMLKASKYDARSCAPVEAMKCGTVTVRAIERGDDDLINYHNAIVAPYDFGKFYGRARDLCNIIKNVGIERALGNYQKNGLEYAARELSWETRMNEIENILLNG